MVPQDQRTIATSDLAQFDAEGWCVVRNVLSKEAAAAAREMMDEVLGPPDGTAPMADSAGRVYQPRPWPRISAAEGGGPVVNYAGPLLAGEPLRGFVRQVEHPIRDARAATVVEPMVPHVAAALRCTEPNSEMCLIHQNFRRTDPSPPPYESLTAGLHMDSGFLPQHYQTEPRQSYVLAVLSLSPMVRGGAAFCVAPGSFAAARRAGQALAPELRATIDGRKARGELPALLGQGIPGSEVELSRRVAQEIEMEVGDLLIFDPMLSHAGSPFKQGVHHSTGSSHHALFSVFAARAAIGASLAGVPERPYAAPATKYPAEFRDALPPRLRGMLDWELPFAPNGVARI